METKVCKRCGGEKDTSEFKLTRFGTRASICNACVKEKYRENLKVKKRESEKKVAEAEANARLTALTSYTPRELMEELARRGYKGHLQYTMDIDIEHF